ncbi:MAG: mannose-1-phosphate guanylyltransferase [Atribacterota bacterium]
MTESLNLWQENFNLESKEEVLVVPVGVIMAGGKGERLWPLSRATKPKQFFVLEGKSFLRRTVERVLPLLGWENIYVVIPEEYRKLVQYELPELPLGNIIVEPVGRNTAPCVGLAALAIERRDPEEVMIVLPADHLVGEEERFREILRFGVALAQEKWLVTLGIVPKSPHTGYGYIEGGKEYRQSGTLLARNALGFREKPTRDVAEMYLAQGNYFWNSGMFLFRADVILEELHHYASEIFWGLEEIRHHWGDARVLKRVFENLSSISIDYAVMEKSSRILVIPVDIPWSDVGSFPALAEALGKDSGGNTVLGTHFGLGTQNSLFVTQKLVFSLGVMDLVLIEAEDLIFVTTKDRSEEVKLLLALIREKESLQRYL